MEGTHCGDFCRLYIALVSTFAPVEAKSSHTEMLDCPWWENINSKIKSTVNSTIKFNNICNSANTSTTTTRSSTTNSFNSSNATTKISNTTNNKNNITTTTKTSNSNKSNYNTIWLLSSPTKARVLTTQY